MFTTKLQALPVQEGTLEGRPDASTLSADTILLHLLDGRPVRVPYLTAGHHHRDDPEASPVVAQLLSSSSAGHPYNGKPLVRVELDNGRILVLAVDRMGHEPVCERCAPLWSRLEEILDQVPAGAAITAGVEIGTVDGIAMLVVDAEDLEEARADDGPDDDPEAPGAVPALVSEVAA